jgi:hypothetical protein
MEKDRWNKEKSKGYNNSTLEKHWKLSNEARKTKIKRRRRVNETSLEQSIERVNETEHRLD